MKAFPKSSARRVRFESFELVSGHAELLKSGRRVRLQDQPAALALSSRQRPGELVSRSEIQKTLWEEGRFVEFDHAVNTAIKKVREALDDDPEKPRIVETLPRKGYRFIAPVEWVEDVVAADAPEPSVEIEPEEVEPAFAVDPLESPDPFPPAPTLAPCRGPARCDGGRRCRASLFTGAGTEYNAGNAGRNHDALHADPTSVAISLRWSQGRPLSPSLKAVLNFDFDLLKQGRSVLSREPTVRCFLSGHPTAGRLASLPMGY
jgi:DNA-binding winged helix-turn-helix (wHTH) protein